MADLIKQALDYLGESLGLSTRLSAWPGEAGLPYFLRGEFAFAEALLLGPTGVMGSTSVVLMAPRTRASYTPGDVLARTSAVQRQSELPVIYVTDQLASHERRRLVQQRVSFVVPGNQFYVPELGVHFKESFRQRAEVGDELLSPSAQALLIIALLHPEWGDTWPLAQLAAPLQTTPMTRLRAARELAGAGLIEMRKAGREHALSLTDARASLWQRAEPRLRSPVQRTVRLRLDNPAWHDTARLAGMSALSEQTMLAPPGRPELALHRSVWPALAAAADMADPDDPNTVDVQLWSYSPALIENSPWVDPLSLMLSLRGTPDERIEQALDALKEQLPW